MIDVVIPFYNTGEYLVQTLKSIQSQTYSDFKCYLINDNSTDDSLSIIKKTINGDSRFIILDKPSHLPQGAGSSRQFGFEVSNSEFVCWFDSDDIMFNNHLEIKFSSIINNIDIDYVVSSQIRLQLKPLKHGSISNVIQKNSNQLVGYFVGEYAFYVHPLWRRSSINKNKLNWNNGYLDDWDFNLQALIKGMKCERLNFPLLYYVVREGSYQSLRNQFIFDKINEEWRLRLKWIYIINNLQKNDNKVIKNWSYDKLLSILKRKNSLSVKLLVLYYLFRISLI